MFLTTAPFNHPCRRNNNRRFRHHRYHFAVVGIFSAYILYDISRIIQGGETNYVSATLAVYLDVYNVFVGLLQLIMAFTGERD